jgi:hypothetical protein
MTLSLLTGSAIQRKTPTTHVDFPYFVTSLVHLVDNMFGLQRNGLQGDIEFPR